MHGKQRHLVVIEVVYSLKVTHHEGWKMAVQRLAGAEAVKKWPDWHELRSDVQAETC